MAPRLPAAREKVDDDECEDQTGPAFKRPAKDALRAARSGIGMELPQDLPLAVPGRAMSPTRPGGPMPVALAPW